MIPKFEITTLLGDGVAINIFGTSMEKPFQDFTRDFNKYLANQNESNRTANLYAFRGYFLAGLTAFFAMVLEWQEYIFALLSKLVLLVKGQKTSKKNNIDRRMEKMKEQKFFDSTIKLFEDYRRKMIKEKTNGYNSNLSNEIHHRLKQLSFIYEKVRYYDRKIMSPIENLSIQEYQKTPIKDDLKRIRFLDEGIVFVETFYFFAWRIICITNHSKEPLPYLKGLKGKAKGITIVRNCFIEHPERTEEKIYMYSYAWGNDERGPTLKNARPTEQSFEISDNGFWKNAKEFKDGFEKLLQEAIK